MAKIIGLPRLSPTMEQGTLVAWAKKKGDRVEVDDLLAEVETDKATMEFRSFDAGVLLEILVTEGQALAPDAPVAILGEPGEDISALLEEARLFAAASAAPSPRADPPAVSDAAQARPASSGSTPKAAPTSGRIVASPLVRRLAREQDLDLGQLTGSGPRGRIIKRDLDQAPAAPLSPSVSPGREPRVEPLSPMRCTIARRLTQAKQQIPHYYLTIDIDAEPLLDARRVINAELEWDGEKASLNDLLIKACAVALRRYPRANASFMGDAIHYHQRVDISVAVAVPDGLVTPVIRDADRKGVAEIAREIRELATRAKAKRLRPEEMVDGTFSISNLGMYGIEQFAAVINPPEGAILAVGTVRDEPVVRGADVVPGKRMRLTLSCDHRVIDGAVGAEYLALLRRLLESPATMIA